MVKKLLRVFFLIILTIFYVLVILPIGLAIRILRFFLKNKKNRASYLQMVDPLKKGNMESLF